MHKRTKIKWMAMVMGAVFTALVLTGCRALPGRAFRRPEKLSREQVLNRMYEESLFFTSLSDTGVSMRVMYEEEGKMQRSPSVRGVLVFDRKLPGVWLRAEKLWQKIFELRAFKDSFWLEFPDSREVITGSAEAYEQMPHLVRPGEILLWLAPPEWLGLTWETTAMETTSENYVFDVGLNGFPLRRIVVDRYDLNIRSIMIYNVLGEIDTVVTKERYRGVNGADFPHRFRVDRPWAGYTITLDLGSPEFDREFPEDIFKSRPRPGWKHIDLDRQRAPSLRGLEELELD